MQDDGVVAGAAALHPDDIENEFPTFRSTFEKGCVLVVGFAQITTKALSGAAVHVTVAIAPADPTLACMGDIGPTLIAFNIDEGGRGYG